MKSRSPIVITDCRNIKKICDSELLNRMKNGTVIAASQDLAFGLSRHYGFQNAFDVLYVIEAVIPEWKKNIKNITNYLRLVNTVEQYIDERIEGGCINPEMVMCLRRNINEMLKAIELLIASNIYPQDLKGMDIDRYLNHFTEIWRRFERDNREIMEFRTALDYRLVCTENVKKGLKDIIKTDSKEIFLFGFYYITAIQKRLFKTLSNSGYKLIFINDHDRNHSFFTSVWENTFDVYSGNIKELQADIIQKDIISDVVNGKRTDQPFTLVKHSSEFEFAEMVENALKNNGALYSPDDKRANEILEKLLPEKLKKRHLLSYPVGQYIYFLHLMWNSDQNDLEFDFEYVYRCFSSGWLINEDLNGIDYTYELKILKPYLLSRKSSDEWISFIDTMVNSRTEYMVSSKDSDFSEKLENSSNLIGSLYLIDEVRYDNLKKLFIKLKNDAEMLFILDTDPDDRKRTIDIYGHFRKIKDIINSRIDSENIIQDELDAAKELIEKLSKQTSRGMKCTLNGVRDAIILMLGGGLSDDEEDDEASYIIRPFGKIDAAVFNPRPLYILLADEFSLPGKADDYPWPLSEKTLEMIYANLDKEKSDYLKTTISMIKSKPLASRYLFFKMINECENTDITIEWICRKDDRYVDVSPYVSVMNSETDQPENNVFAITSDREEIIEDEFIEVNAPENGLLPEPIMDYRLCKRRYIYSYILNDIPVFTTPFHYGFLYPKLINYYQYKEKIEKNHDFTLAADLKSVIPIERQVELAQAEDHVFHYNFITPMQETARLHRHYLYVNIVKYINQNERNNMDKYKCNYCPYNDVCLSRNSDN